MISLISWMLSKVRELTVGVLCSALPAPVRAPAVVPLTPTLFGVLLDPSGRRYGWCWCRLRCGSGRASFGRQRANVKFDDLARSDVHIVLLKLVVAIERDIVPIGVDISERQTGLRNGV